ncbi:class I SAM-dependent methyltransferase [Sutcliffiella horikoshii]|uniref:class I SAM-dependent methyltransferase n=1 Tax=Sutcliffiella horikoshii TaxID=79883 RepID=UPI001F47C79F|nr:class I SAM-dependent methyltransferase [Sutcliffiella horikoshii]MCG1022281.1 class I SAM-dependent methyltransferase [Sutcliffiella horikoshii]
MGREFVELFNDWANYYDATVSGKDQEYAEVFRGYEDILKDVAAKALSPVVEFGVGTGNLTAELLKEGHKVYAIEPSKTMREKAAEKLPETVSIEDGDFLSFPAPPESIQSIVSTYAFHHLTDKEKEEAVAHYGKLLDKGGKIVFADTVFENEEAYRATIEQAEKHTFLNLANDLRTEYYTTMGVLTVIFEKHGFKVEFQRFNHFVWVMEATKQ